MNRLFTATFALASACFGQPSLTLSPAVITSCNAQNLGRTRIFWNAPSTNSVRLLAGGLNGSLMGVEPPQGSTGTGDWVSDGMVFALATADGQQLASATARVLCQPPSIPLTSALAASSYFPLDVGDEWVYRYDSRFGTAVYESRRVERAEIINGTLYYVVSFREGPLRGGAIPQPSEVPYRTDSQGRVYYLTTSNTEQLLFDPANATSGASYKVLNKGEPLQTALGNFPDALNYDFPNVLIDERGTYARGVGLIMSSVQMLTGSSGGFLESYNLVYARIAGNVVFAAPAPGLDLTVESRDLNVSGGQVTNCAIPCYYAACGLGSPVDPPGTYIPCFQARARLQESVASFTSGDPQTRNVLFDLLDASNNVVSSVAAVATVGAGQLEAVVSQSILVPLTPGTYRLRARITDANNVESDSAIVAVKIR